MQGKHDPNKFAAIKNVPKPTSKSEVLTLLGFVKVAKLSYVSAPLRELTTSEVSLHGQDNMMKL